MKTLFVMLAAVTALSGCISSSNPPAPSKDTTVIVQPKSATTVVCSDGTQPPCN